MRRGKAPGVDPGPDLVLQQATRDEGLGPELLRRKPVLGKKLRERDRGIEVDQRSSRSASSSVRIFFRRATGRLGGGCPGGSRAGVIQPPRTASASRASESKGLRLSLGGTSSATTRSRSVTRTVSPRAARRTYSESLFFRV